MSNIKTLETIADLEIALDRFPGQEKNPRILIYRDGLEEPVGEIAVGKIAEWSGYSEEELKEKVNLDEAV